MRPPRWYGDELGECDTFCEDPDPDCGGLNFFGFHEFYLTKGLAGVPNAKHEIGSYGRSSFAPSTFAGEMRDFDAQVRGCTDRSYSTSRADGVNKFQTFEAARKPYDNVSTVRDYEIVELKELVENSANRAVFASVPAAGSTGECDYHDFYVFGSDGTVMHIGFDYRPAGSDIADSAGALPTISIPSESDMEMLDLMNGYGHNGSSSLGTYESNVLDYEQLKQAAQSHDAAVGSCKGKLYSTDSADALARFDIMLDDDDAGFTYSNAADDAATIRAYIAAPLEPQCPLL